MTRIRINDVEFDGAYINIHKPNGVIYDFEIRRCESPEDAFRWLCHLSDKNWFTPQMAYDLVKIIRKSTTINEYCRKATN